MTLPAFTAIVLLDIYSWSLRTMGRGSRGRVRNAAAMAADSAAVRTDKKREREVEENEESKEADRDGKISQYELERLERIKRNEAFMASLSLSSLKVCAWKEQWWSNARAFVVNEFICRVDVNVQFSYCCRSNGALCCHRLEFLNFKRTLDQFPLLLPSKQPLDGTCGEPPAQPSSCIAFKYVLLHP